MSHFQGSLIFKSLADQVGLPVNTFNFLFAQLLSILIGLIYRQFLPPSPKNIVKRHLFNILIGVYLSYFCYGKAIGHILAQTIGTYLGLKLLPRHQAPKYLVVFAMAYLCLVHLYLQVSNYGYITIDISTPLMVTTQKLTSMIISYYDGSKDINKLTKDQQTQVIREMPSFMELISYIFNFQGVIIGPLCFYNDYIDFINGNNILKSQKQIDCNNNQIDCENSVICQPSNMKALGSKLLSVLILGLLYFRLSPLFPITINLTSQNESLWYRIFQIYMSTLIIRIRFYFAWMLADAVGNASGLGFNGYDSNGQSKWDLITNIRIFKLETSTSIKMFIDNWNIQTQIWLRRIAYDRMRTGKTIRVILFSSVWHGFYPGYYLSFISYSFAVYAGRGIRRKIRPFFIRNKATSIFYSILNWPIVILAIDYIGVPFAFYDLKRGLQFYNSWYWFVQIATILIASALPCGSKKRNQ